jgi:hypothetical protein
VGVAELDDRLVSEEAFGMAGTAGDIVGGLLHVDLGEELHVGVRREYFYQRSIFLPSRSSCMAFSFHHFC